MPISAEKTFEDKLLASLQLTGIPPRPVILEKIVEETSRPEPDFRTLSDIVSEDVGICASLLKTVNSPFYGLNGKAQTIQRAIQMLGLQAISCAIASITLRRVLPNPTSLERFWDSSGKIARLSGWLAQNLPVRLEVTAGLAYTFGLFRDCGIPIMLRKFPDYLETLRLANQRSDDPFTLVEDERHGTNHALVGYMLAQSWWLPSHNSLAIRHHHELSRLAGNQPFLSTQSRELISLALLAEYLLQQLSRNGQTCEWKKMGNAVQEQLQLEDAEIEQLVAVVGQLPLTDG